MYNNDFISFLHSLFSPNHFEGGRVRFGPLKPFATRKNSADSFLEAPGFMRCTTAKCCPTVSKKAFCLAPSMTFEIKVPPGTKKILAASKAFSQSCYQGDVRGGEVLATRTKKQLFFTICLRWSEARSPEKFGAMSLLTKMISFVKRGWEGVWRVGSIPALWRPRLSSPHNNMQRLSLCDPPNLFYREGAGKVHLEDVGSLKWLDL